MEVAEAGDTTLTLGRSITESARGGQQLYPMAEIVVVVQAENSRISLLRCQTHQRGGVTDEVLKMHPVGVELLEQVEENRVKAGIVIIGPKSRLRRKIIDRVDDSQAMIFLFSHTALCPRAVWFSAKDADFMFPFLQSLGQIVRDHLHPRPFVRRKPMNDLQDAHRRAFVRALHTPPGEHYFHGFRHDPQV